MVTETTVVILHMAVVKKSNSVNFLGLTHHRGQLVYHHMKGLIGHALAVCIHTENQNQVGFTL